MKFNLKFNRILKCANTNMFTLEKGSINWHSINRKRFYIGQKSVFQLLVFYPYFFRNFWTDFFRRNVEIMVFQKSRKSILPLEQKIDYLLIRSILKLEKSTFLSQLWIPALEIASSYYYWWLNWIYMCFI